MLTGDVTPTLGSIYIAGYDATGREDLNGVTKARQHVGYCPQVDPLLDLMSVRETLVLFGRLRGIGRNEIDAVVERLMERLMLVPHADKTCESLSGGNKRKVSLGIALVGEPDVLLIDESSSGLDPLAKRRMWNLISTLSKNKTVVLTTHSMEEAVRVQQNDNNRKILEILHQGLFSIFLLMDNADVSCARRLCAPARVSCPRVNCSVWVPCSISRPSTWMGTLWMFFVQPIVVPMRSTS